MNLAASSCPPSSPLYRTDRPVEWRVSAGFTDYQTSVAAMEARVEAIIANEASELVWLLEHPPLYTAGISARPADLLAPERFPVFETGRGGQYTYHGPGQRVIYVMLDLRARGRDVRCFVAGLEDWLIEAFAAFGVAAEKRDGRVGLWVAARGASGREDKIAAIGVRLKRFVSYHGAAANIAPDLDHFSGIIPCGIADHGVTSLGALGVHVGMAEFDQALRAAFERRFGPIG